MTRSVLVAGATGLVGRELVRQLSAAHEIAEVRALVRRTDPELAAAGRVRQCVTDYERLDEHAEWFTVDAAFCALGSTIRKAGSEAAFRRVDFDYPLTIARLARQMGTRHFLLVSAVGADPKSPTFYTRVKGELEEALRRLEYPSLTIVRPSFLLGNRRESRPAEFVGKHLGRLLPRSWRSVPARAVARALVQSALHPALGELVIRNAELAGE